MKYTKLIMDIYGICVQYEKYIEDKCIECDNCIDCKNCNIDEKCAKLACKQILEKLK